MRDASKEFKYYRNASGIVTHYSATSPDLVATGVDSLLTIVHYNTATSRYTSYVLNINIQGFILLDSSVFVYDGSGNIIGETDTKVRQEQATIIIYPVKPSILIQTEI